MSIERVRSRRLLDLISHLPCAVVIAMLFQRKSEQRAAVGLQLSALREKLIQQRRVHASALAKHVNHVSPRLGIYRLPVTVLSGTDHFRELVTAPRNSRLISRVT